MTHNPRCRDGWLSCEMSRRLILWASYSSIGNDTQCEMSRWLILWASYSNRGNDTKCEMSRWLILSASYSSQWNDTQCEMSRWLIVMREVSMADSKSELLQLIKWHTMRDDSMVDCNARCLDGWLYKGVTPAEEMKLQRSGSTRKQRTAVSIIVATVKLSGAHLQTW